jgi:glycosyltransferase involved in cell wall biosynthesis
LAIRKVITMKVSVITVCYNSEKTISGTLRSVKNQEYENVEHLIIDGQSSDKTMLVVKSHHHQKLKVRSEPDQGIYDAMNKGVQLAEGDIIGILNSDDIYMHKNVLNEVVSTFTSDPTLDVILGDVDYVKNSNLEKSLRSYRATGFRTWMFRFGFMPPHPGVFVRKTAYERVGYYRIKYKIAADFDFLLRLLLIDGARYLATGKHWVRMLNGGASTSSWRSNYVITREMKKSLSENRVFSSTPMLLLRLPVKLLRQMIFKMSTS